MGLKRARGLMELWPWAGLLGASVAWALSHQIGSYGAFDDCGDGSPLVWIVSLVALLLAAASGLGSWRLWRTGGETETRRFIAAIGALFALLLAMAILLQVLAGLILPECAT